MDSYISFETALMLLVTAYLVSVTLLVVVADVAIATIEGNYNQNPIFKQRSKTLVSTRFSGLRRCFASCRQTSPTH